MLRNIKICTARCSDPFDSCFFFLIGSSTLAYTCNAAPTALGEDMYLAVALLLVSTVDWVGERVIYPQSFKSIGELSFHG